MEYLKKAPPPAPAVSQEIRDTVSRVISEIEREGVPAVRRYSERFDGWNPPSDPWPGRGAASKVHCCRACSAPRARP
jgi:hypothetical protein